MKIATFKLEDYLSHYEFKAPYLLCCSDAETMSMHELLAMAGKEERASWENLRLGYTEVPGSQGLREAIVATRYPNLSVEQVLCFSGAEEGIFCALNTMLERDDHVIALKPAYQSLVEIPKAIGCNVTEIALQEHHDWRIDIGEIKRAIGPKTKCVIVNFPHNPTGQVLQQHELTELVSLLDRHGIWLFSDEAYRHLGEKKPDASCKPAACMYDKALSLSVMSKAYGLAGLRIGWIACKNHELLERIARYRHYTSICSSAPSEVLSIIALKNHDAIVDKNNGIIERNLTLLDAFFDNHERFSWVRPQGGCVGFVRDKSSKSTDDLAQELLQQEGVLLLPSSVYDAGISHFRIGFGRQNMDDALARFERYLA